MVQVQSYREASKTLLQQAYKELDDGDLRQASEKAWGAAAQIIKAIAQQREWEHETHRHIRLAADRLTKDTEDRRINRLYRSATSLHVNWYENWDSADEVSDGLTDVEQLVGILDVLVIDC